MEEFELENAYCGNRFDRRCLEWMSQIGVSLLILIFAMYQLLDEKQSTELTMVWLSILNTIVGIHLPTPKIGYPTRFNKPKK